MTRTKQTRKRYDPEPAKYFYPPHKPPPDKPPRESSIISEHPKVHAIYTFTFKPPGREPPVYVAFRGNLQFDGEDCDEDSLPPIRRPGSKKGFLTIIKHGFVEFGKNCDSMNPAYVLDGPTITRMWLSLLHERYATWSPEVLGTQDQRLRILEKAEMQNEVAMTPDTDTPTVPSSILTSTLTMPGEEEEYATLERNIRKYWEDKKTKRNCPDLDCGSGDCRFSAWYHKPDPIASAATGAKSYVIDDEDADEVLVRPRKARIPWRRKVFEKPDLEKAAVRKAIQLFIRMEREEREDCEPLRLKLGKRRAADDSHGAIDIMEARETEINGVHKRNDDGDTAMDDGEEDDEDSVVLSKAPKTEKTTRSMRRAKRRALEVQEARLERNVL